MSRKAAPKATGTRSAPSPNAASGLVAAFLVPGLPHPYLIPDANPGYRRVRDAYDAVRTEVQRLKPDLLLLYSTQWLSVVGHQVQARAEAVWDHVDPEWHELGHIPYKLRFDPAFGAQYVEKGRARGLEMRTVDYHGFPIDTGTVIALKLLDPDGRIPASVVSCNMYADRAETIVLGKAARDAAQATGKRVVAVAVTALSSRLHTGIVPWKDDRIHSLKDDEWNRKYLEFLGKGRLEDASQLAREFSSQANGDQKLKAVWWLSAVMGASNAYDGRVFAYEPLYGTGAALVGLTPTQKATADKEFDEDDAEVYLGDRNVLSSGSDAATLTMEEQDKWAGTATVVHAKAAPKPVGAYAHARLVGDLLFLAGIGPRTPGTDEIPGGPIRDANGKPRDYDVRAQTRQCIENVKAVLKESGASLEDVFDVQVFLVDMDRDFAAFNEVYGEHFGSIQATRTTVEVEALPTPIAVELKVIAQVRKA
ncbi:MAG: 2-aminophenol/2-amino-5-chlorophenol 1,6-dioxygenase subunit alpha [Thermoplasmata archaeon]|jgi:2-aminophenol/2-amino-5-chlorophenol 1,6-dioxygenase alpha subunit|nr:2-aminophenol/2-amino-5-chlorophenol 1,6-dioxygenase subunit alpha [Thermoplasmata archaeon]